VVGVLFGKRCGSEKGAERQIFLEKLERRCLLSNSVRVLTTSFDLEAGQPFTVLGQIVDQAGTPVAGVNVTAEDGLLQQSRPLGTTTPHGYFSLPYSGVQTQQAGGGLFMVRLSAPGGATAGLVLNSSNAATPNYEIKNAGLTYGAGSAIGGAFGWVNSFTKAVAQKTQNLLDVDSSGHVTASDYFAIGKEIVPSAQTWLEDLSKDVFRSDGKSVTPWGFVSGVATVASWVESPYALPIEAIKVSSSSIVDSLSGLGLISPAQAQTSHNIIDALDSGLSLAQTFTADPVKKLKTAGEYASFVGNLIGVFNSGFDYANASLKINTDVGGNATGLSIVLAPNDPTSGAAVGAVEYCFQLTDTIAEAPLPFINYATPNLIGKPVPQRQMLVIRGSGFLDNSLLEFNDGITTYRNRIPSYVLHGQGGDPDEIGYNIAVGNETANWTVRIVNGSKRSAPYSFSVTAQPDDGAPAAPLNLTADYAGSLAQNLYSIDWSNPTDFSGIKRVWYKLGSAPTSPTDGLNLDLDVGKPLWVVSPTSSAENLYIWLEDGAGNKDQTHASSVLLVNDPGLPHVDIGGPTAGTTYSTNSNVLFLSGSSSDLAGTIGGMTWSNSRRGSGSLVAGTNWSSGPIELFSGTNVLTVTAVDGLGNMGTDTLTVEFAPPTVTDAWLGGVSSDWNDLNNWSAGRVPNGGDVVGIYSGVVNVASGFSSSSVWLYGGTMYWTGGTITGNLSIASGASLNISGGGDKYLYPNSTLTNAGTIVQSGAAVVTMYGYQFSYYGWYFPATINNLAGALYDLQGDGGFQWSGSWYSASTINNAGTFRKSSGSGTSTLGSGIAFNNTGTVEVNSGMLSVDNGLNQVAGAIVLSGGWLVQPLNITRGALIVNRDVAGRPVTLGGTAMGHFNVLQHLGTLVLNDEASAVMPGGVGYLQTGGLAIGAGAKLDLNDNDLIATGVSFSQVQGWVYQGYSSVPDSTRTGIVSTAGQNAGGTTILALFNNSLIGVAEWPPGSGNAIGSNAIVGKYTYLGDTDWDGQVTPQDYTAIDANLGATGIDLGMAWFYGDTDFDGNITPQDYTGIDAALGLGVGNPLAVAVGWGSLRGRPVGLGLSALGSVARRSVWDEMGV
jgi:hypothetical protein